MPHLKVEHNLKINGLIAGTDEAGRGPWVGPVVAAAVCFPALEVAEELSIQINDSKKLTAKKREFLFDKICTCGAIFGIGEASSAEIDSINILQASFLAMKRALDKVEMQGYPLAHVLVDGNRLPEWKWPSQTIIGGDGVSLSIAAASILAKVTRDRMMTDMAKEYPFYGFEKNAGYGTADHIDGLMKHGITPHHRKSYAPIKKMLDSLK